MAGNDFDSNITRKLMKIFLKAYMDKRILSKSVDTMLLRNVFNPSTGDTVDYKRPTDFVSKRTPEGDISATTSSPIVTGKASAVVQDYITVEVDWLEADEAIKMDQIKELLDPMADRIVTDLELDFAEFAMKNTGLLYGTPGTPPTTWGDVAGAGATMTAHGVPVGPKSYFINPFTQVDLAGTNRSLGSGGVSGGLIKTAVDEAVISRRFAGMDVKEATTMGSYTTESGADRAGTLTADPLATYVGAKDTMTQSLAVTAFEANLTVQAGETIQITGRFRLNLSTRRLVVDGAGAQIVWTATVNQTVQLGASGEGNIIATGPAIFEAGEAYNTVDTAPLDGDIVTLLGPADTTIQPNLFWHKQAFGIGFVPIKKLFSTDTVATTRDGIQMRVSKGASIRENKQILRIDLRPAYAALNPFFAGQGFGTP